MDTAARGGGYMNYLLFLSFLIFSASSTGEVVNRELKYCCDILYKVHSLCPRFKLLINNVI